MPRVTRSASRRLVLLLALCIPVAVTAGCGSQSDDGSNSTPAQPQPVAKAEDFPTSSGRNLPDIINNLPAGPVLAPSVSILEKGTNRVGFALFDNAGKQLSGAGVSLYIGATDGSSARGPFLARAESLKVSPQFESKQTATDPDAARGVYVADVPFKHNGKYAMLAIAQLDGRLVATTPMAVQVGGKKRVPPAAGEKAPVIHTLTPADVAGDVTKIDTRI